MPRESPTKYDLLANCHYPPSPYHHLQTTGLAFMEQQIIPVIQDPIQKKKHICPTCDRTFTTSGHLARHARVHTGEKNHKCPFPGCETRCSRQDNLQQHYRIHLSPGSRRSSTSASRAAMIKSYTGDRRTAKRGSQAIMASTPRALPVNQSSPPPSPPIAPPPLEQSYSHDILPGPDSPPALVQATLPGLIQHYPDSVSSRSASPPEYTLTPAQPNEFASIVDYPSSVAPQPQPESQYGNGVFHDHSHSSIYAYENTSPLTQPGSVRNDVPSDSIHSQPYTYSNAYNHDHSHIPSSPIQQFQHIHNTHTPPLPSPGQFSPIRSRHSISHISHPGVYPHAPPSHPPTTGPSSPASIHSGSPHTSPESGSPTPAYSFHDEIHERNGYHTEVTLESLADSSVLSASYYNPQSEIVSSGYDSSATSRHSGSFSSDYDSPPPLVHSEAQAASHTSLPGIMTSAPSQSSPYLHHPRPMSGLPQYHIPLQPTDWAKSHTGLTDIHN